MHHTVSLQSQDAAQCTNVRLIVDTRPILPVRVFRFYLFSHEPHLESLRHVLGVSHSKLISRLYITSQIGNTDCEIVPQSFIWPVFITSTSS